MHTSATASSRAAFPGHDFRDTVPDARELLLRIGVKVVPGASKNGIVGWLGEDLKVRIQAPATDGKANDALCKFLAREFRVPVSAVTIFSGFASRKKIVEMEGIGLEALKKVVGPNP